MKLTEEEMILRIFTYLDKLFHIVKPQKLIFMAIDGASWGGLGRVWLDLPVQQAAW